MKVPSDENRLDSDSFKNKMSWKQYLSDDDPLLPCLGQRREERVIDGAHQPIRQEETRTIDKLDLGNAASYNRMAEERRGGLNS